MTVSCSLNMGNSMPLMAIGIHTGDGQFLCKAHGPLFQGHVLVYDPTHNATEWVQFKGVASDALPAEEAATFEMLDYVPLGTWAMDLWLDRFG